MAKVILCDLCEGRPVHTKIKMRGHITEWAGIVGIFRRKLYLCDDCYVAMQEFCKMRKVERNP